MSDEKIVVKVDPDLEDLIPGFLSNRANDLAALREALTSGNYQSIQSIGHSLKGVGGGYGFTGMSEIGAAIETAAKQQSLEDLQGLIDRFASYLDAVEVVYE
jgi:HPt (histidine-containing phosphotransfer) domain-containing protein